MPDAVTAWLARRRAEGVAIDGSTLSLAALTVLTQAAAVGLFVLATQGTPGGGAGGGVVDPPTRHTNPGVAVGFLAIVVIESAVIAGLFYLWRRLPDWLRRWGRRALVGLAIAGIVVVSALTVGWPAALAIGAGVVTYWLSDRLPFYWVAHDAMAVVGGVAIAAVVGAALTPRVAVVILIGLAAWDLLAVDRSGIMQGIVGASTAAKLPNYVVIPATLYVDFEAVRAWLTGDDEKPAAVANVLGLGDLVVPALLAVAAYVETASVLLATFVCLGTVAAWPLLGGATAAREGGVPALPWLNAGALCGYGVGWLLVVGVG